MRLRLLCLLLALLSSMVGAAPSEVTPLEQDRYRFPSQASRHGMVVSAETHASQAGVEVLRRGGNAVDAAVATAYAMAVTLPRAGNLGGGGFLLVRTPAGEVAALDFREVSPRRSARDMFLDAQGVPDRNRSTIGALSVAVPGTVAGLDLALRRFGTRPLKELIEPARKLAEEGFVVPLWLSDEIRRVEPILSKFASSRAIFLPDGSPIVAGAVWKQKDLARTLALIQERGSAGFYQGEVAQKMVASIRSQGGIMTEADLAGYQARWRTPVTGSYRGVKVYSMPPPSSGGIHLIQALNVLEGYDLKASGHNSALTLHRLCETLRQVYADRSKWLGDPDFVKIPTEWLLSQSYANETRAAIPDRKARRSEEVGPGQPPNWKESPQTTHFCVVDAQGMAVSLTYTLNFSYGSGLVAEGTGVLLNNEMEDFSAAPGKPNAFGLIGGAANAIEPGKRPLSTMTPTILEKDGKLLAVIGSPGGSRILTVVLQVILNLVDFELNAQTAVSDPRLHHQWRPDHIEAEQGFSPDTLELLRSWGHRVVRADSLGHAMVILVRPDGLLEGGADPRRTAGSIIGY